jgi:hypothetical protein
MVENWVWAVVGPTAGGVLWFALRWVGRHLAGLVVTELDAQLHLDAIRNDVASVKEDVIKIRDEVTLNSGTSLKDRVLKIEHKVDTLTSR